MPMCSRAARMDALFISVVDAFGSVLSTAARIRAFKLAERMFMYTRPTPKPAIQCVIAIRGT
eukprot:scaffold11840_cov133-Isochrysis_galbana.AAC.5